MESNIDSLTKKLYEEGISKAEADGDRIIFNANEEAKKIIEEAKNKSEVILNKAKNEANKLNHSVQSEMQLAYHQMLGVLRQRITDVLTDEALSNTLNESLNKEDLIKEMILLLVQNIQLEKNQYKLQLLLNEKLKRQIDNWIALEVNTKLKEGVHIEVIEGKSTLIRISEDKGKSYLEISEATLEEFFRSYLRDQIKARLSTEND